MKSAEKPASPFLLVNTSVATVLLRAPRYGIAVDFNGKPYLGESQTATVIGPSVEDFIAAPVAGNA